MWSVRRRGRNVAVLSWLVVARPSGLAPKHIDICNNEYVAVHLTRGFGMPVNGEYMRVSCNVFRLDRTIVISPCIAICYKILIHTSRGNQGPSEVLILFSRRYVRSRGANGQAALRRASDCADGYRIEKILHVHVQQIFVGWLQGLWSSHTVGVLVGGTKLETARHTYYAHPSACSFLSFALQL